MKRILVASLAIVLSVASAWAAGDFLGGARGGQRDQPVRRTFFMSSPTTVANAVVGSFQCLDTILFPANFAGGWPDANSSVSCGTTNGEPDTYTFKVAGSTIGQVVLSGPNAPTFVQQTTGYAAAASVPAGAITVTSGDALIACTGSGTTSFTLSVADNNGGVWSACPASAVQNSNVETQIFYSLNHAAGSTTVTLTQSGGANGAGLNVAEFSKVATSTALDICGAGSTGSSTSPATTSITTTNALDVVEGCASIPINSAPTSGPTNSFTSLNNAIGGGYTGMSGYNIVSSTGTYSTGWGTSGSNNWTGNTIALKGSGGGSPCTPTFTTTGGLPQTCAAGSRFEVDGGTPLSGANVNLTIAGHVQ